MPERVPVTFSPAGITVWVDRGATILDAARRGGVVLPAPCGGRGVCGSCGVRVVSGAPAAPDELERRGLSSVAAGVRLACRARVDGPLEVRPVVVHTTSSHAEAHEPPHEESLVAAVDLGTTTVSAVIVGSATGRELGRATTSNAQQSSGADVLTRLSSAIEGGGEGLRIASETSVLEALRASCARAGTCLSGITRIVIAGNTAMTALLAGADVGTLSTAPFGVPDNMDVVVPGGPLASALPEGCEFVLLPAIASFVGGDVSAGLLAAGLLEPDRPALYVDIGTNAEIAVVTSLGTTVASAAAGPAFEGFGIAQGGSWAAGAVERVSLEGAEFKVEVAGGGEPEWVCGSGLVSAIATLRRAGHLSADGRMSAEGPLSSRFATRDGVLAINLGTELAGPYLLQTDIRAFQQAKAAVAAGVVAVVRAAGVKARAIDIVRVAGAFGGTIASGDLAELGVLPSDLVDRADVVNDAALLGAAMIAFDDSLLERVRIATQDAAHVELAADPSFAASFIEHTALEPYRVGRGLFG